MTLLHDTRAPHSRLPRTDRSKRAGRLPVGVMLGLADATALLTVACVRLPLAAALTFAAVALMILCSGRTYNAVFSSTLERSVPHLLAALGVAAVVVGVATPEATTARLVRVVPILFATMVLFRAVIGLVVRWVNRRTTELEPVVLLGAGTTSVLLVDRLIEHREYGLEPIGFVDRVRDDDLPLPVLGDVSELEQILARTGARRLLVAFGVVPESELVAVIRKCQSIDVDVWVVPRFFELGLSGSNTNRDEVWGIPLARLPRLALRSTSWRVKRLFDLVVASVSVVLVAPLFVLLAAAIKLTSPGPVFFRQQRVGQRGRIFELLKFRSLPVNDDSATTWSVDGDIRIGRLGRFLRHTSLDELPQLFNVLGGDMSLVGPRPERPYFVDMFRGSVHSYDDRHRVPVGITGLAQVNGLRGDTSIEQRSVFDNNYIENWSLWSDIVILFRTVAAVLRHPGHRPVTEEEAAEVTTLSMEQQFAIVEQQLKLSGGDTVV